MMERSSSLMLKEDSASSSRQRILSVKDFESPHQHTSPITSERADDRTINRNIEKIT